MWQQQRHERHGVVAGLVLVLFGGLPAAQAEVSVEDRCLLGAIARADGAATVAELRAACSMPVADDPLPPDPVASDPASATAEPVQERLALEKRVAGNPFAILPHRPNYVIAAAYNTATPNNRPFREENPGSDADLDRWESKFQISLKVPVAYDIFGDNGHLYFAYTNRSFWQVFNDDASRPFRETNHEPEAWLSFENDWELFGWRNALVDFGISHQSNGRGGSLSRSWNRLYARLVFERGNTAFGIKPWWRIPENSKRDDNPDIEDYLGNFEFQWVHRRGEHIYGLMLRNNLDFDDNKGAVQFDWSFPLTRRLRGYLQWFNGYGESLIDYDARVNSLGIGLRITDWL